MTDNRQLSAHFEAAARRLLEEDATQTDVATVHSWVERLISRRFRSIDAEDIAQETLTRIVAIRKDGPRLVANPAGYITRIAQHLAVDAVRRQAIVSANSELVASASAPGESEDDIAALLDRSATQATIAAAIGVALRERDHMAVRVVTIWLDLADELKREPTSREVATRAHASHTTVIKALARLRALLASERS